jgi:signal peptidase I
MDFTPPTVSEPPPSDRRAEALQALVRQALDTRGQARVRLHGDSMWPTIPEGSLVRVERLPISGIRLGDVVVWQQGNALVAHRVVQKIRSDEGWQLRTRGDNCAHSDRLLLPRAVLGRVTAIVPHPPVRRRQAWSRRLEAGFWVGRWRLRSCLGAVGRGLPLGLRHPLVRLRQRLGRLLSQAAARAFPR